MFLLNFIQISLNFDIISTNKIKLRLQNNQLLIGNRKIVKLDETSGNDTKIIYEFLGVPFAEKPIRARRFEFPQRLANILPYDIYDATNFKYSCLQIPDTTFENKFYGADMWNPPDETSEDCLYMNIWVPISTQIDNLLFNQSNKAYYHDISYINITKLNANKTVNQGLSTLFWIYGGSFVSGSINLNVYKGVVLAAYENVIVVSANYRLGAFGFLYLNNSYIPGNAGLVDQLLAMSWYKEHYLTYFDASDKNFCVFGESAGSMSIHYHTIYAELNDKQLFNCAILQSGTAYSDIAYRKPLDAFKITLNLAKQVNCISKTYNDEDNVDYIINNKSLINQISTCLKYANATLLLNLQFQNDYVSKYLPMPLIPTNDYFNYYSINPLNKLKFNINHQNISFLFGINNDEGTFFLFYAYLNQYYNLTHFSQLPNETYKSEFMETVLKQLVYVKKFDNSSIDDDDFISYTKCLNQLYDNYNYNIHGNNTYELNIWQKVSKIVGDIYFSCPTIKLFNKMTDSSLPHKNENYFYKFSYRSPQNPWPQWMGVSHGYEIDFIFGIPLLNKTLFSDNDRLMSKMMMNYWANFAKYRKV